MRYVNYASIKHALDAMECRWWDDSGPSPECFISFNDNSVLLKKSAPGCTAVIYISHCPTTDFSDKEVKGSYKLNIANALSYVKSMNNMYISYRDLERMFCSPVNDNVHGNLGKLTPLCLLSQNTLERSLTAMASIPLKHSSFPCVIELSCEENNSVKLRTSFEYACLEARMPCHTKESPPWNVFITSRTFLILMHFLRTFTECNIVYVDASNETGNVVFHAIPSEPSLAWRVSYRIACNVKEAYVYTDERREMEFELEPKDVEVCIDTTDLIAAMQRLSTLSSTRELCIEYKPRSNVLNIRHYKTVDGSGGVYVPVVGNASTGFKVYTYTNVINSYLYRIYRAIPERKASIAICQRKSLMSLSSKSISLTMRCPVKWSDVYEPDKTS
jgi:hypothetical protein